MSLLEEYQKYLAPNYQPHPVNLVSGKGSLLFDDGGKEYIDLAGGIAVSVLGHQHPVLGLAVREAADAVWHLSNYWINQPAINLARELCGLTFAERVFFANSGAEANEAALKLTRKYAYDKWGAGKHRIVSFTNSFHGRTLFTASVTGQSKYSREFAPLPAGIDHLPFNDCGALKAGVGDDCCAVILEPVQGEGGVVGADVGFVRLARELCNRHKALLVFDEIQSGVGRTGRLFAYQGLGVAPDVLTSAKALGGGLPIGAMLTTAGVAAHLAPGSHGSTFGGNPFVTRVALAVLKQVSEPDFLRGVVEKSLLAGRELEAIHQRLGCFAQIRCFGLLIGCELAPGWRALTQKLQQLALEAGVLVLPAAGGNVLRLAPPLNIPPDVLAEGLKRLAQALTQTRGWVDGQA